MDMPDVAYCSNNTDTVKKKCHPVILAALGWLTTTFCSILTRVSLISEVNNASLPKSAQQVMSTQQV